MLNILSKNVRKCKTIYSYSLLSNQNQWLYIVHWAKKGHFAILQMEGNITILQFKEWRQKTAFWVCSGTCWWYVTLGLSGIVSRIGELRHTRQLSSFECFTQVFAGVSGGSVNCNTAQHRGFVQQQDLNCHEIGNMSR